MASGLSDRALVQPRHAARQQALSRLTVVSEATRALERALGDLSADAGLPAEAVQALLAGAQALIAVTQRTGVELSVSVGPEHEWVVHVGGDTAEPRLQLHRRRRAISVSASEGDAAQGGVPELALAVNGPPEQPSIRPRPAPETTVAAEAATPAATGGPLGSGPRPDVAAQLAEILRSNTGAPR